MTSIDESTDDEFTSSGSSDISDDEAAENLPEPSNGFSLSGRNEQFLDGFLPTVRKVSLEEQQNGSQESENSVATEDIMRNLMEEAMNTPLPDSDDDFDDFDEEPSDSEAHADAADGMIRRPPIVFKSEAPEASEYKQHVAIGKGGNFVRKRDMVFVNSSRTAARREAQRQQHMREYETETEQEEEEEENYAGMQFTGRDFEGVQLDPPRPQYQPQYQPRPYRHFQYRPFRARQHMSFLPWYELLSTEEAEALLKETSRFEYIDPKFTNQNQYAMPDELIFTTLGKNEEYMPESYVCPRGAMMKHHQFTKEEREQERERNNLIYQLICDNGPLHVEDLWKALLNRQKRDDFPFNGFFGFYRFISDRSHIYLMDSHHVVYNQNLLVTVSVMRYAHSLYHSTPIEMTPKLFKLERGSLFFRAFLSTSTRDELSFDRFFPSFPAIFKYDDEWKLNLDSVTSIPSVFDPSTLPRRERFQESVDRSIFFSGTGKVISNNLNQIKIESEETLRKGMPYLVFAPPAVVGDQAEMLPVGTRVAYTGVRCYNGTRFSVKATSIAPQDKEPYDFDGTLDDFWCCDDDELEKPVEKIMETQSTQLRMVDERSKMAEREKDINEALLNFRGMGQNVTDMWHRASHMFNNDFAQFNNHIIFRPFYFNPVQDGQSFIILRRSPATTKAMIDLLSELEGKDGRSVRKDEAREMHATKNSELDVQDQFVFEELNEVLDTDKMLLPENGKPRLFVTVRPLIHWDPEHKVMMRI